MVQFESISLTDDIPLPGVWCVPVTHTIAVALYKLLTQFWIIRYFFPKCRPEFVEARELATSESIGNACWNQCA